MSSTPCAPGARSAAVSTSRYFVYGMSRTACSCNWDSSSVTRDTSTISACVGAPTRASIQTGDPQLAPYLCVAWTAHKSNVGLILGAAPAWPAELIGVAKQGRGTFGTIRGIASSGALSPFGNCLRIDAMTGGQLPQTRVPILYHSTDRLSRCGAAVMNLSHSSSLRHS